jgi:UDP-N-acetylglucosamine acyltransferase
MTSFDGTSPRKPRIHSSAIIDRAAQIADDVEIGPYSIIGPAVTIGAGTAVQSHVVIEGDVRIGSNNTIGHGAIIGAPPQDVSFEPTRKTGVVIGDGNLIREYCTIHRGSADNTATRIGDGNFLMVGVHLAHNCAIGDGVVIANNCLLGGYVTVHDQAFVGGASVFHQNMRVGRLVMVQGHSAFGKDLPPFTLAARRNAIFGLNVIGLRRAGISPQDRQEIKIAFKIVYLSGLNISQALEKAATMTVGAPAREFFDFVAEARKRGLCPYRSTDREEAM